MVVFQPDRSSCSLFEIKHSSETHAAQRHHLFDTEKLAMTETRFGTIESRCVLYRGEADTIDGIRYENVEEYLLSLRKA